MLDEFNKRVQSLPPLMPFPSKYTYPKRRVLVDRAVDGVEVASYAKNLVTALNRLAKTGPNGKAKQVINGDVFLHIELCVCDPTMKNMIRFAHIAYAVDRSGPDPADCILHLYKYNDGELKEGIIGTIVCGSSTGAG